MHRYLPLWDCHSGWDGRPIVVELEDLGDFMKSQRVRKIGQEWTNGELTWFVIRIQDDDADHGS